MKDLFGIELSISDVLRRLRLFERRTRKAEKYFELGFKNYQLSKKFRKNKRNKYLMLSYYYFKKWEKLNEKIGR
jgi:hypothetical protein